VPAPQEGEKQGRIFFGTLEKQGLQLVQQQAARAAKEQDEAMAAETLPFSQNIAESQERYSALLEQLELSKRARQIAVPTNDSMVRARLRELGEPVTFFAEQPPERRERLREILLRAEGATAIPSTTVPAPLKKRGEKEREQSSYFTEGSAELRMARRFLAEYSLQRAKQRVFRAKRKRDELHFEEELRKAASTRDVLRRFSNMASQIGDDRPLSYCSFSPDSSLLATASWSGQSKLWSIPSCELKNILKGHADRVGAIAFHPLSCISQEPTALNLASCSSDHTIKLWSLQSSTPLGSLEGHTDRVSRLAFHPCGRFIGTTGSDKTWRLWDVEKGRELLVQEGHSREVYGITFQCDGSLVATSGMDSYGRVWDLRTGRSIMLLKGHAKQMLGIDFALNGYQLATGSGDNTVKIWDLRKKRCSYTIPAHSSLISHVKFHPSEEGQFLMSSSFDGTCRLWSTRDWSPITTLTGHEGKVLCADISPDNRFIASSSFDRTWKLFSEESGGFSL